MLLVHTVLGMYTTVIYAWINYYVTTLSNPYAGFWCRWIFNHSVSNEPLIGDIWYSSANDMFCVWKIWLMTLEDDCIKCILIIHLTCVTYLKWFSELTKKVEIIKIELWHLTFRNIKQKNLKKKTMQTKKNTVVKNSENTVIKQLTFVY